MPPKAAARNQAVHDLTRRTTIRHSQLLAAYGGQSQYIMSRRAAQVNADHLHPTVL